MSPLSNGFSFNINQEMMNSTIFFTSMMKRKTKKMKLLLNHL